jgi:hypothetical protein
MQIKAGSKFSYWQLNGQEVRTEALAGSLGPSQR